MPTVWSRHISWSRKSQCSSLSRQRLLIGAEIGQHNHLRDSYYGGLHPLTVPIRSKDCCVEWRMQASIELADASHILSDTHHQFAAETLFGF